MPKSCVIISHAGGLHGHGLCYRSLCPAPAAGASKQAEAGLLQSVLRTCWEATAGGRTTACRGDQIRSCTLLLSRCPVARAHQPVDTEKAGRQNQHLLHRARRHPAQRHKLASFHQGGPARSSGTMTANGTVKDTFLFTSESVNEGHPDKLCDQVCCSACHSV